MRLIDADNINFHCNYDGDCTGDIDDCKECGNYICDFRDIQEQPTAYSVDKAVEQLEKIRLKKTCNKEKCDTKEICRICVVDDAIEIVKHGGVSDDVCEWKSASDGEFIQNPHTKRLYSNEPSMQNVYCNTCGKKIKIVGD